MVDGRIRCLQEALPTLPLHPQDPSHEICSMRALDVVPETIPPRV